MPCSRTRSNRSRRALAAAGLSLSLIGSSACARRPPVETGPTLALRRVVIYRNGIGYFERSGRVTGGEVNFRVSQSEVGDFLATLAVMEQGGSTVRAAAFPMPEERADNAPPAPERRRDVRLSLDGGNHDLVVGYTVETPIWRPTYRLVFQGERPQVQAWGIVQNLSGEDWTNVNLSLVSGSPVSFRSELATPVIPMRPVLTDRGAVIDAVPQSDTTLAQSGEEPSPANAPAPPPSPPPATEMDGDDGPMGGAASTRGPSGASASRRSMAPHASRPPPRRGIFRPQGIAPPEPPPSSTPRNLAALAALAVQGGATRYDLPQRVTVPDRTATMVMLTSRDVPGEQMYLFAPDPGVGDSAQHPFHVARFENRTGGTLERGPIAIFERNAFLGQGMMESLPDGATTTVPFSLERGIAVETAQTSATEGSRLVRMVREALTIERYSVTRTTYRARNGMDRAVRLLYRHALNGAQLFEPPPGTETANGNALVPTTVPTHGHSEVVVTARVAFSIATDLSTEQGADALAAYLRDGHPPDAIAATLRTALDLRRQITELTLQRTNHARRRDDLQQQAEETRENLRAIQRNRAAADLRAQLTQRLARSAIEIDQAIRQLVEIDTQIGEKRVRLMETLRGVELDVNAPATPANAPARP